MNIDMLHRAAALMREQHGPEHERHAMWSAMADWQDGVADDWQAMLASPVEMDRAVAVARAYLGESP
jgi:hypothetical protein